MRAPLILAAVLLVTSLSGCTEQIDQFLGREPNASGELARRAILDINDDSFAALESVESPEDFFKAVGQSSYEYTQKKGKLEPAKAQVAFVDIEGRDRSKPLSDFTQASSLGAGDTVVIDGLHLLSPISITVDSKTAAARGGVVADWFEVGGYPMPLAAEPGSKAVWHADVDATLDLTADRLYMDNSYENAEVDCNDDGCTETSYAVQDETNITNILVDLDWLLDVDATLEATSHAGGTRVAVGLDGALDFDLLAHANVMTKFANEQYPEEDEETNAEYGVDLDTSGTGSLDVLFDFDGNDQLTATTGSGTGTFGGTATYWNDTVARSAAANIPGWSPPYSESFGPEKETIEETEDPVGVVAELMADLWGFDLAVGDELRMSVDLSEALDEGGFAVSFDYDVEVVGKSDHQLSSGTTVPVLELSLNVDLSTTINGTTESIGIQSEEFLIHETSYFPVKTDATFAYSIDQSDLATWQDLLGEDGLELPKQMSGALNLHYSMQMSDYSGTWQGSALLSGSGALTSPLTFLYGVPLGMMAAVFGSIDGSYEDEPSVPEISLTKDQSEGMLTVVRVDANTYWGEFSVTGCADPGFDLIQAGDQLTGCSGDVSIVHYATDTLVFQTSFA